MAAFIVQLLCIKFALFIAEVSFRHLSAPTLVL